MKSVLDISALLVALGSAAFTLMTVRATEEQTVSTIRNEINKYADEVVELDREADERNISQITVRVEQAASLIERYSQARLGVAPAAYRLLAEYAVLDTSELQLAEDFALEAIKEAQAKSNKVEEIRAYRVLADVAASHGDVSTMSNYIDKAFRVKSEMQPESPGHFVVVNTDMYTGPFAVYSSLWARQNGGGTEACAAAQRYFSKPLNNGGTVGQLIGVLADKEQSLQTSRRAYRLRTSSQTMLCDLHPQNHLRIPTFSDIWRKGRA